MAELEIVFDQPPFIDKARNMFRLPEGVVFTFGRKIYNPSKRRIDEHLYAHESHHGEQQGNNPMGWWAKYLNNPAFRASQEIPAYQIQYQSAKKKSKDRNKLHSYLVLLAKDLSGEMYAGLMTFHEAMKAIKSERLYNFNTTEQK